MCIVGAEMEMCFLQGEGRKPGLVQVCGIGGLEKKPGMAPRPPFPTGEAPHSPQVDPELPICPRVAFQPDARETYEATGFEKA